MSSRQHEIVIHENSPVSAKTKTLSEKKIDLGEAEHLECIKNHLMKLLAELEELKMPNLIQQNTSQNLDDKVRSFEIKLIKMALIKTSGNQSKAAELLKLKRSTINEKIKKYGIDMDELRKLAAKNL